MLDIGKHQQELLDFAGGDYFNIPSTLAVFPGLDRAYLALLIQRMVENNSVYAINDELEGGVWYRERGVI